MSTAERAELLMLRTRVTVLEGEKARLVKSLETCRRDRQKLHEEVQRLRDMVSWPPKGRA